jgi:hypothetical protein
MDLFEKPVLTFPNHAPASSRGALGTAPNTPSSRPDGAAPSAAEAASERRESTVIRGLDARIHPPRNRFVRLDRWVKPGDDDGECWEVIVGEARVGRRAKKGCVPRNNPDRSLQLHSWFLWLPLRQSAKTSA